MGGERCNKCNTVKTLGEFHWKNKKKNIRHSVCNVCVRRVVKAHYQNNHEYYLQKNAKARRRKVDYLIQLRSLPCKDCNQTYPYYVMEFDHRGDQEKEVNVTSLVNNSWNKIRKEVAKCDVVCCNCHAIRTYNRRCVSGAMVDTLVLETNAL